MPERHVDVFFYGLFMDQHVLEAKGVQPSDARRAAVTGFTIRIGARAALAPVADGRVHGILMKLSHADLEKLYAEPSVRAYRPDPVLATTDGGEAVAALCYNLPDTPAPDERNAEYAAKLKAVAERVGLPREYIDTIQ